MAASALVVGLGFGLATAGAQAACLSKREIQDAVSSGQIKSLDTVLSEAGVGSGQQVLNVQVCDQNGQLVYVIGVLSPDGQARNLTLNAQ